MIPNAYENFILEVRAHFDSMCEENPLLFVTDVDCDRLWELYLDSIPPEENKIFRTRREYDCSACRNFVKHGGNVVAVKDGKLTSIWDVDAPDFFGDVVKKLSGFVKAAPVSNVFLSPFPSLGVEKNRELWMDRIVVWEHLFAEVPGKFVNRTDLAGKLAEYRATKEVFQRGLQELSIESIDIVLDLISQNSLYRGEEWKSALEQFRKLKSNYDTLRNGEARDLFVWENLGRTGTSITRIRNHSMGTLLADLSEGMDLEAAVTRWEKIMAPSNYKRPKAIFTQQMLEEAKEQILRLGYLESLPRRFATLNDITVNNILFANRDAARRIPDASTGLDFFSDLKKEAVSNPRQFSKVQEIGIEDFVQKVLPTARNLEVFFENRHTTNLVSLIAPVNREAPSLFKWENGFSWAYTGNIADSRLKERVKAAGGAVDGVLRFSIQWNDVGDGKNDNDEDAHCLEPNGTHIYYSHKRSEHSNGSLDVDIQHPRGKVAVENITWPSTMSMLPGVYKMYVHTYAGRGGRGGFRAEIEADGIVHTYDYPHDTKHHEKVYVADVTLHKDGQFTIKDKLPSGISSNSKTVWGISTNQFIPVSVVCYSPNWWDEQTGNGNRHYFFMLKDCVNDESPNGFYNEQLKQELLGPHKRVLEALGARTRVQDTPDQLSGLGFSSTRPGTLVVRVTGATERLLKIRF
ncbi:MAG: hypothetical protein Q4D81_03305 [Eubacteriales bacterium]|nr:hypothetical protein [Eubacteriales bacterium]